jgi:hypothetical protein
MVNRRIKIKFRYVNAFWKERGESGGFLLNPSGAIRLGPVRLSFDIFPKVGMRLAIVSTVLTEYAAKPSCPKFKISQH